MSEAHVDKTLDELNEKLNELTTQYDSKLLAASLLMRSAHLLRMLLAAGYITDREVEGMMVYAATTVAEPMPVGEKPIIMTLNAPVGKFAGRGSEGGKAN